jgi:DNA modification methylase
MVAANQVITDRFAIYNADCIQGMRNIPDKSIHASIYSPPFASGGSCLYQYSSHERDLSNCDSKEQFFEHYSYVVKELTRITMPGRLSAVHCMDVPSSNSGRDGLSDFPGDIIRLHEKFGWEMAARHGIWKEPLAVRLRTMQKNLAHQTLTIDSTLCGVASMDQLLVFRNKGDNPIPVTHPNGMDRYVGKREIPQEILKYRHYKGKQTENLYSHWIWRQYASSFWDDIRIANVLPYKEARDSEDERHVHALQLDVIERFVLMRTNPKETILTPFLGVGSEAYGSVINNRRAIGFELKPSYFRQAVKNLQSATDGSLDKTQLSLF